MPPSDSSTSSTNVSLKTRLRRFIRTVSDDLNLSLADTEEVSEPRRDLSAFPREESLSAEETMHAQQWNDRRDCVPEKAAGAENVGHDAWEESELKREQQQQAMEAQIYDWREAWAALREAREQRKSLHSAKIQKSYVQIESLIEGLRAIEAEVDSAQEDTVAELPESVVTEVEALPAVEPFSRTGLEEYASPSFDLLRPGQTGAIDFVDSESLEAQKNKLQETLDNFAVDAYVCDALVGPRVTQYRVRPGFGVKVGAISNLDKNIALSMAVNAVRIQSPIPGEPFVGIEVPNIKSLPINLRTAFDSRAWRENSLEIPLVMGMDIAGHIQMCDLAKAPHMLIAGATGSGKSVCISNLLLSLLYKFKPDELELVLVDPKKVEFAMYKDLPHLIHPLVDDPKLACQALKWLVREMEGRYTELSQHKVRNLAGYNAKAEAEGFPKLPYIVLVIDELADLMMTARADIETPIARLAQMSRAVGIHTVLATQRPSVNVITGTIKANYPTRVAFQVSSVVDSRTILDAKGAESLQGKGDMLFSPPGIGRLLRLQSPFVDDDEILRIADHLRAQAQPRYRVELKAEDAPGGEGRGADAEGGEGLDPLLQQAVEIVASSGKASTSFLQRRLKVGYNRAANLIEELESRGYIGPQVGSNPREILVEPGDYSR